MSSFRISPRTKRILKHFLTINPSLLFKTGRQQSTVTPSDDLIAVAEIDEEIPCQFGIYDLSRFLSILETIDVPTLECHDDHLTIYSGSERYDYRYCAQHNIKLPEADEYDLENVVATFPLDASVLKQAIRIIKISKHPQLAFVRKDKVLFLTSADSEGTNCDRYARELMASPGPDFTTKFKFEKMILLMPQDYTVTIAAGVTQFEAPGLKYYVSPEV